MEQIRNLGQLCRQHYEKIILSLALLLLAGAAAYLFNESKKQADKIQEIPKGYERRTVKAVQVVDLAPTVAALKRMDKPAGLLFSGPHNLFNPVQWRQNRGSTTVIKVVEGDEVGPKAMQIVFVRPINMSVAYSQTVTSGTGAELIVNGYWMLVTNETFAATARGRLSRLFISLNATNKDSPFILREVKGGAQEPTGFDAEFKDGEKFSFTPTQAHFKTIGHEAELKYPNSTNTTGVVRKNSSIDIDGQPHKVVDITPSEVVLSDDSNGKLYPIRRFVTR